LLALFEGWTVDASGQVHFAVPPPRHRGGPALIHIDGGWDDDGWSAIGNDGWGRTIPDLDPASQSHPVLQGLADFTLELLQYVGNGIAMTNPLKGLALAFISAQTQKLVDSLGGASRILGEIADMLAANNVALENDLSRAAIRTYEDWAHEHYDASWIQDIMTKDPKLPDVADKVKKLEEFVTLITKDLDSRNAAVLTAVNLMAEDDPQPSKNLLKPSSAMLKAAGYFYGANYMLVRGRQAFNVQYTKEGAKASLEVCERLVAKSKEYLAYAQKLSASVDRQVDARLALIWPRRLTGGAEIFDAFKTYDGAAHSFPWDVQLNTQVYDGPCCTSSGCDDLYNHVVALAEKLKGLKQPAYRKHLCSWFWGDSTTATFDDAVRQMKDNDAKLQALYAACQKEANP
jgi:hypothetical protein